MFELSVFVVIRKKYSALVCLVIPRFTRFAYPTNHRWSSRQISEPIKSIIQKIPWITDTAGPQDAGSWHRFMSGFPSLKMFHVILVVTTTLFTILTDDRPDSSCLSGRFSHPNLSTQLWFTPPKFNSSPLKNGGWKTSLSYWGLVTFQGQTVSLPGGYVIKTLPLIVKVKVNLEKSLSKKLISSPNPYISRTSNKRNPQRVVP